MKRPSEILDPILAALSVLRNIYREETALHRDARAVLESAGYFVSNEHRLSRKDRIDILIPLVPNAVGIEIKTRGDSLAIARQCYRYGDHLRVVMLLTTTPVDLHSGFLNNNLGQEFWLEIIKLNLRMK